MAAPARWRTKTRIAMMVSGVRLFELTSGAVRARVCADGRLICVGILAAFFFVVDIQERTRRKNQNVIGKQMAIAANQISRLAAPRKVKRDDQAPEQTLALHAAT